MTGPRRTPTVPADCRQCLIRNGRSFTLPAQAAWWCRRCLTKSACRSRKPRAVRSGSRRQMICVNASHPARDQTAQWTFAMGARDGSAGKPERSTRKTAESVSASPETAAPQDYAVINHLARSEMAKLTFGIARPPLPPPSTTGPCIWRRHRQAVGPRASGVDRCDRAWPLRDGRRSGGRAGKGGGTKAARSPLCRQGMGRVAVQLLGAGVPGAGALVVGRDDRCPGRNRRA